jgi:hypothetical protein
VFADFSGQSDLKGASPGVQMTVVTMRRGEMAVADVAFPVNNADWNAIYSGLLSVIPDVNGQLLIP